MKSDDQLSPIGTPNEPMDRRALWRHRTRERCLRASSARRSASLPLIGKPLGRRPLRADLELHSAPQEAVSGRGDKMTPLAPRIIVDPQVRFGRPVIEGTRVPVELIVGKLAGGMSTEEVAADYGVTREDILAALAYAARAVAEEQIRAVP